MAYVTLDHVQLAMPPSQAGQARRVYVHDPFGNRIEILQPG